MLSACCHLCFAPIRCAPWYNLCSLQFGDTKYSQANCNLCNAVMQAETLGTLWAAHWSRSYCNSAPADACTPCWASWPKFYKQITIPFPLCPACLPAHTVAKMRQPAQIHENALLWKITSHPHQEINIMPSKGWDNHQSGGVIWPTQNQDKTFNPNSLQTTNKMLEFLC